MKSRIKDLTKPCTLCLSIVFSMALLTFTAMNSHAQSFHLGLKAGTNIFKLTGRSFEGKFQFSYTAGAFAELNLNKQWGIQPELLINGTQGKTSAQEFNQIYQGVSSQPTSLAYVTLPVLIAFHPVPEFTILAGAQYGYLVYQTQNLVQYKKDAFKKGETSIVFGGQFNFGKSKLGARYIAGLSNINDINSGDTWKNGGFQLYFGFRII